MLITIYNNNESDRFETDFKSNLILPKNCELKLTNAYIALSHEVTIPELSIVISANGSDSTPRTAVVLAGTYTLQGLADVITTSTQAVSDGNSLALKIDMSYDVSKGYGIGCYTLDIKATSLLANIFISMNASDGGFDTWSVKNKATLVSDVTANITEDSSISYLGATAILDSAGTPVATSSWGYLVDNEEISFKYWLRKGSGGGILNIPPITTDGAGCFTFEDNANAENYYIGLNTGAVDFGSVADSTFPMIESIDNTPAYVLIVKTTSGSYNAGEAYFYENSGGFPNRVAKITATHHPNLFPIADNDSIGVVCNNGGNAQYYLKRAAAGSVWKQIPINHGASRHTFDDTQDLYLGFSIYSTNSGTAFTDASIKNPSGTFVYDDDKYDKFGQQVSWDWGTSGTGNTDSNLLLGFTDKTLTNTATGTNLAIINKSNEAEVPVDGSKTESTWKTAPYINLLCESLPVNSYTDTDTDIGQNGLDNSKCIASIPRYDLNGNFNVGYNLTYNPVEANVIKLNNAEEINVSQLRFRLQQSDGQIPRDLASPMGFVLDFNSEV